MVVRERFELLYAVKFCDWRKALAKRMNRQRCIKSVLNLLDLAQNGRANAGNLDDCREEV